MTSPVEYRHLAGSTLIGTYILMLLGAYMSAIGAGLACPDWPTCYGILIPFFHPAVMADAPYSALQIFAEWAHRTVAAIVGVLILSTVIVAWRPQRGQPLVTYSATLALVFLPVQVLLGQLTVTRSLQPVIVTAHLGVAILILLALTTTTLAAWLQA